MEHAGVEVLLFGEMGHAGYKRLPERPIIGPFRKRLPGVAESFAESPQKVRSLRRGHWRLRLGQQGLRRYGPKSPPANEIQAIYSGWQRVVQTYVVQYSSRLINYGAKGFGLTRKVGYAQNHHTL